MLKKKPYIQEHKATAEKRLAERTQTLQTNGKTEKEIQRDATVRHFKGKIRQAVHQLAEIAALEGEMAQKAQVKAEKLAAPKAEPPKKKPAPNPEKKKAKKERKVAVEADE